MQENLRLMLWTAVAVIAAWFVIMTVDIHVFLHSDADDVVGGTIAMNKTDIGDKCGTDDMGSTTLIDYKLNLENQMVYLCPQGLSPIRKQVVAGTISDEFRKSLSRAQLMKVNQAYPVTANTAPAPAATETVPAQTPSTDQPSTVPSEVIPVQPAAPVATPQTRVPAQTLPPPVPQ